MKKVIIALLSVLFLATSLPAQATVISRDEANEFYASCMSKRAKDVKVEMMNTLCACTSARLMQSMTSEELLAMQGKTGEGRLAMDKMLMKVYAPCSEIVAIELINYDCVHNEKLRELNEGFDVPEVCACAAGQTAQWYKGKSKTLMADILKSNPTVTDPVPALMAHPLMKNRVLNNLVSCSAKPPAEPPQTMIPPMIVKPKPAAQ